MQGWQVWVARSHLFPFPILNLRLTAAIKHPSCSPADGNDSTVGENDLLMAAGLPPFRAGGSRSRLETPLPRRGVSTPQRIGKALIGGSASAPQSCSPFRKPGKSDLLFHHQGGEERGKKKKEGKSKEETERLYREWARVLAVQLAADKACPRPRLKNKGARATFQWKISGDGPDAPRDRYLTPTINHKR